MLDFFNPVRILSGGGCFKYFDGFAAFGKRCLIVCGAKSARLSGALSDAEEGLCAAGIEYSVFDRAEQNPLLETVFEGGREAREQRADFVIGIGGGSPLDAAKAVAAFAACPVASPEEIFTAERPPALPVLAVNTTAGTGSEVTPYSILTVRSIENKRNLGGEDLFPKIAFCDPAYTMSLPPGFTMSTAVDALCHAVEGYFMKKATLTSDALAEKAMPLLAEGIREAAAACGEGSAIRYETRKKLLYASTLAGMVISRTGTGFVHSTGYMLTYHDGVPHGAANAYFLADFVAEMAKAAPKRAETALRLCGVPDFEGIHALVSSCAAMPLNLKLDESALRRYASKTVTAKNVANAVEEIGEETLLAILRKRVGGGG